MNAAWMDEYLTSQPYVDILADIIGHPHSAPSIEELEYMNPDLDMETIQQHVIRLRDVGIIEELAIPPSDRVPDHPHKFYSITEDAQDIIEENNVFDEDAWKRQYASVKKTDHIESIENIPRPQ